MSAPAASRAADPDASEGRPMAVLFEVGNVLVRWSPRALYTKLIPDPAALDHFLSEVCPMSWHAETDRGVPFADNIARRVALYPEHADLIRAWHARWDEMFLGAIPESEAAIEAMHDRGVPMHALTNMAVESWPMVQAMSPAFARLDVVVVSGAEGVIKPDPAIYEIACARTGRRPQDMLFIDDSLANVEAARELGFHTHHFTDPAALRPQLAAFGLL